MGPFLLFGSTARGVQFGWRRRIVARFYELGGLMQGESNDSAGISAVIVDADGAADLFGCVLHLPEAVGAAAIEIDAGIPYPDHDILIRFYRLDVDALILGAVYGPVQEVPKNESQEVLVRTNLDISIYLIDYYCFAANGTWKKAHHQLIHKMMEGNFSDQISSH